MTCGSGSLLLRALSETPNGQPTLYGQEKDSTTASLAKLNMLLHGIVSAEIKVGDTLGDPQFTTGTLLDTFDVCVANPPFSQKNWMPSNGESDLYHRWNPNLLPPAKCGDFAFLLHLIGSMKPDTGRGACILPHGVLFRGNAEYTIRRHIVERHCLKGIVGLPPNLFYGTGIPACILILDKHNTAHREGIFFIDAKDGFMKDGNKNRLREQDIKRIVDVWNGQQPVPHYARMVTWEEIEQNDFNLNIPRYVQPRDTEVQHDIDAHLHGGIPVHDVEALEAYWQVCLSLKSDLFAPRPDGRYDLATDKQQIAQAIAGNDSFVSQQQLFTQSLDQWRSVVEPEMKAIDRGCSPTQLISRWSESLLQTAKADRSLADAYSIYDRLMNYWAETMQDDCYMVSNDGWTLPSDLAPEKKSGIYSDITCDLLPVSVLLQAYFSAETAAIAEAEQTVASKAQLIDSFLEEQQELFDNFEKVNESVIKKAVKDAVQLKFSRDGGKAFKHYLDLCKEKKEASKALSDLQAALTDKVLEKYAALSEEDIRCLVVENKWMGAIMSSCMEEMQQVTQQLSAAITAVSARYERTLPSLEADAHRYEDEVNGYLKEMGFFL